jgi:hypothetical protein
MKSFMVLREKISLNNFLLCEEVSSAFPVLPLKCSYLLGQCIATSTTYPSDQESFPCVTGNIPLAIQLILLLAPLTLQTRRVSPVE